MKRFFVWALVVACGCNVSNADAEPHVDDINSIGVVVVPGKGVANGTPISLITGGYTETELQELSQQKNKYDQTLDPEPSPAPVNPLDLFYQQMYPKAVLNIPNKQKSPVYLQTVLQGYQHPTYEKAQWSSKYPYQLQPQPFNTINTYPTYPTYPTYQTYPNYQTQTYPSYPSYLNQPAHPGIAQVKPVKQNQQIQGAQQHLPYTYYVRPHLITEYVWHNTGAPLISTVQGRPLPLRQNQYYYYG